jgi:hypothetical protein
MMFAAGVEHLPPLVGKQLRDSSICHEDDAGRKSKQGTRNNDGRRGLCGRANDLVNISSFFLF